MLDAAAVKSAIDKFPAKYATVDGRVVVGDRVSNVASALRGAGWRNVPRLDSYDLRKLGLEVVAAEYVGGARPTGKFIEVVVIREYDGGARL